VGDHFSMFVQHKNNFIYSQSAIYVAFKNLLFATAIYMYVQETLAEVFYLPPTDRSKRITGLVSKNISKPLFTAQIATLS